MNDEWYLTNQFFAQVNIEAGSFAYLAWLFYEQRTLREYGPSRAAIMPSRDDRSLLVEDIKDFKPAVIGCPALTPDTRRQT